MKIKRMVTRKGHSHSYSVNVDVYIHKDNFLPEPGGQTGHSGIFCANTSVRIPSDVILCPHTVQDAVANEPLTHEHSLGAQ